MVRASAKNHANVAVVVSPDRYDEIIAAVAAGGTTLAQRRGARPRGVPPHGHVRRRRRVVDRQRRRTRPARRGVAVPGVGRRHVDEGRRPPLRRELAPEGGALRLAWAAAPASRRPCSCTARRCRTTTTSTRMPRCGPRSTSTSRPSRSSSTRTRAASRSRARGAADPIADAHRRAHECDPGLGVRRRDRREPHRDARDGRDRLGIFTEVLVAPGFEAEAVELLTQKKNIRLLTLPEGFTPTAVELRQVSGGLLLQQADRHFARRPSGPSPRASPPTRRPSPTSSSRGAPAGP